MCGTTAEVLAALKEPEPTPELDLEESEPVSAPESDATVDPLLPPAPEPTHESNQDPVTEDEPIVIEDDADETNE